MKRYRHLYIPLFSIIILLVMGGWGQSGHYKINNNAALSYNQEMTQFYQWSSILADHASDADMRKAWDPTEAPKHYIDIDNYPEFLNTGTIPQTLEEAISIHGAGFVYDQGILPWATLATFDSLQSCFENNDWDGAVLFAADLGHYVADGHMPLHITRNYNGQYSGNQGIHSRYEIDMIDAFYSQISYEGNPIDVIDDVNQYVFDYLYSNYSYVDSVLAADDYATSLTGSTSSSAYYNALWEQSEAFTVGLFQNASHTLAELMYTAWVNAGSPIIADIFNPDWLNHKLFIQSFPNPTSGIFQIGFSIPQSSKVTLELWNVSGQKTRILVEEDMNQGSHQMTYRNDSLPDGLYFLYIKTENEEMIRKIIIAR
ncbi:MAG: T9SS type A sorting domain-containing protein [Bacteroidetes bacterium]|nr:T9SS type A sorting domain-containing protein [Bacteroidota bacterium]